MHNRFIEKLSGLGSLQPDDIAAITAATARARKYPRRHDLIREGDRPGPMFVMLEGWACRYKVLPNGSRQVMAFMMPGDGCDLHVNVLAHMDHSIQTITPALVATIPRETMESMFDGRPAIARAMYTAQLIDEGTLRAWIVSMGRRSSIERVAHLMCELWVRARNIGLTTADDLVMPLSQAMLADALGMTPVHVTSILWIRDAATMRMEFASPAYDTIYGIPGPERGGDPGLRSWARLIEPKSRKAVLANFRRVRAGERIEVEFRVRRASDGALRWIHNTDFPLRDAAGRVRWVAGLGADITDAKESVDRQGVLVAELQHRTRNLIAVVRSLSDRTLDNAVSLDDFGKRFRLRLSALSRVQGLLSHLASGERVTFDELLRSELFAHGAIDGTLGKVTLEGPPGVPLRSGSVQTLALALHELATNAVKYGALATAAGHLAVRWHVETGPNDDPPRLHVDWRESGVVMPQVNEVSRRRGYGRELAERALPYQLRANTTYELGTDGVRCTIAVPVSRGTEG